MTTLLDINVLIAVADADHPFHASAISYFKSIERSGWATCPLTENGFIRIFGNPNYPGGPSSTENAREILSIYCAAPGHQFWSDSISLTDTPLFPKLGGIKALTDQYLLALAIKNQGRFASFDQRMDPASIPSGENAFVLIPS